MDLWEALSTRPAELITGFIAGNVLWFSRQWLWQKWVKGSHRLIIADNRVEEKKTRDHVSRLFLGLFEELNPGISDSYKRRLALSLGLTQERKPTMTIENHLLPTVTFPVNRYSMRRKYPVSNVVLHWTAGPSLVSAVNTLKSKGASYHYMIDGETVWQLVDESRTAYHAGVLDVNHRTIGISFVGMPDQAIKEESYATAATLLAAICSRHHLDPAQFLKHSQIKPTACPGTLDVPRLVQMVQKRLATPQVTEQPNEQATEQPVVLQDVLPPSPPAQAEFPRTFIAVAPVYVRATPDHTAPLAGSRRLNAGDTFTAVGRALGSDPYGDGRNTWIQSNKDNYVWEGALK